MSVSDSQRSTAGRWLRWAHEDLKLAEHSAADEEVVARGACVWAHQAGEKALKALLVFRGVDPPKLHDLDRLTARLPENDALLFDDIDLPDLSRWAIEGRYPGDLDEASSTQARRAISIAAMVVTVVGDLLQV